MNSAQSKMCKVAYNFCRSFIFTTFTVFQTLKHRIAPFRGLICKHTFSPVFHGLLGNSLNKVTYDLANLIKPFKLAIGLICSNNEMCKHNHIWNVNVSIWVG